MQVLCCDAASADGVAVFTRALFGLINRTLKHNLPDGTTSGWAQAVAENAAAPGEEDSPQLAVQTKAESEEQVTFTDADGGVHTFKRDEDSEMVYNDESYDESYDEDFAVERLEYDADTRQLRVYCQYSPEPNELTLPPDAEAVFTALQSLLALAESTGVQHNIIKGTSAREVSFHKSMQQKIAHRLPFLGIEIPASWLELSKCFQAARKEGKMYLSWKECLKLAKQCQVPDLPLALQFLHDTGDLFYFSQSKELATTVFIVPHWIIEVIRAIVSHKCADDVSEHLVYDVAVAKTIGNGLTEREFDEAVTQLTHDAVVDWKLLCYAWARRAIDRTMFAKLRVLLMLFQVGYEHPNKALLLPCYLKEDLNAVVRSNRWPAECPAKFEECQLRVNFPLFQPAGVYLIVCYLLLV